MTKWIVFILLGLGIWLFWNYGVDFISKVNTTVNNANSSMERGINNVNQAIEYNNNN